MSWASPPNPGVQTYAPNAAFTPISVRQGFGQTYQTQPQYSYTAPANTSQTTTNMMPPAGQPQPAAQKIDWPDTVRAYVRRAFEAPNWDRNVVSKEEIEIKLKETITLAQQQGMMYNWDWATMKTPQELIKDERQQALMGYPYAAPPATLDTRPNTAQTDTFNPKKRKSAEFDLANSERADTSNVPWRSTKALSLEDRISKPSNDKRPSMDGPLPKSKFQKNAEKRLRRFDGGYQSSYRSPSPPPSDGPIVGFNENLEKNYFRLTAPPKPCDVRPERVLAKTLEFLKQKWKAESNYGYINDQFKSLRQDLTVQHIRNELTVKVYEVHARIALEKKDLGEYNQCQTQLRALYKAGIKGRAIEFKAYRILYFIHTANRTSLNDAIADLTTAEKEEHAIKHALEVRSSLAWGNYHKLFQLYMDPPNMGGYLMDMFVERERLAAMATICKAFKRSVKLRYITEELGFENDGEALEFLLRYDAKDLLQVREDAEGAESTYYVVVVSQAGNLFETARAVAFRKVDLKGQI
ncbi:SAC3/GANP/Nin1/mts3/eIF-3 p25 family-domain-containing protein [Xylariomycetidae sp. FL2044]|nr:SAC3/GANP/Nin1/mts3/eIF-3 p25 family-domain-containing protein [Xylariomycetidae sp. FL2044]